MRRRGTDEIYLPVYLFKDSLAFISTETGIETRVSLFHSYISDEGAVDEQGCVNSQTIVIELVRI